MATTTTSSGAIVLYDIAQKPPVEESVFAPNPWKSRFALNFKGIPYSTTWVSMPDIRKVRQSLGEPACRKFADGTDFYTLPVIQDAATGTTVGDSFDIAVYLQRKYPNSGAGDLFPPQTLDYTFTQNTAIAVPLSERQDDDFAEYARFNTNVDAAFTTHILLGLHGMPLDPATAELTKAEMARRVGANSFEDFALTGDAREKVKDSFRDTLGDLAKLFLKDTSGPFLLGQQVSYADFIVGGWLRQARVTFPETEWHEVKSWHGGVFGRLYDALQVYAEVK
ncbi:hypothetical protein QQS21_012769 [Conoideocrella luteorostrata]|uniref:GST N-terminal domain-containing protein n=1 Tax=Conoideocrella luteorostrata TaxID=1105319 RepID=A0AAJ0FM17_9HYPO|nr:hypothetical protein QQS21_012769 [Conoideocrella luteorostrata]